MAYFQLFPDAGEAESQCAQELAELVVQFTRQTTTFFFLSPLHLPRQPLKPCISLLQRSIRPFRRGDIDHGADHPDRLPLGIVDHLTFIPEGSIGSIGHAKLVLLEEGAISCF